MKRLVVSMTVILTLALARPYAKPDDVTAATAVAVGRWVDAVRTHTPGQRDAALEHVAALTFGKRVELSAGMALFFAALQGKHIIISGEFEKQIVALGRAAGQTPGANAFLERAAVLHADTAFSRLMEGVTPTERPDRAPSEPAPSALLSQGSLYLDQDGEILGETPTDWNWPFARSLVDLISPAPADDPFVATWYHATGAFMFQHGQYGEVVTHLRRAAVVLPDDPLVLFDRASYAEIQGLPRSQVLLSDQDVVAIRALRSGRSSLIRIPASSSRRLDIPPEDVTNNEAERLFRRALRADPSLVEARVRLGRLLDKRKRHEEAASELATALAANPTGPVLFYAHLFAGRAAQSLGKIPDAAEHFKAADLLYPGSQSAHLARSQAALLASDVPAALEPIAHLDKSSSARDPWWQYHLAAGRDADALLRGMWAAVLR